MDADIMPVNRYNTISNSDGDNVDLCMTTKWQNDITQIICTVTALSQIIYTRCREVIGFLSLQIILFTFVWLLLPAHTSIAVQV